MILDHCVLDPAEEEVGINFLGLKRRQKSASFSTEFRFIHKRGNNLSQKICLKKTLTACSLRSPALEKDLPKHPLSLMHSPSRKPEPLRKVGVGGTSLQGAASFCFGPRISFLWGGKRKGEGLNCVLKQFTFLCGCGGYMACYCLSKSP